MWVWSLHEPVKRCTARNILRLSLLCTMLYSQKYQISQIAQSWQIWIWHFSLAKTPPPKTMNANLSCMHMHMNVQYGGKWECENSCLQRFWLPTSHEEQSCKCERWWYWLEKDTTIVHALANTKLLYFPHFHCKHFTSSFMHLLEFSGTEEISA